MTQNLHADRITNAVGAEYFFLGNGRIQAAIQWVPEAVAGTTNFGLLLWDPDHFCRKWSTHLFHPEYGIERTQIACIVNGVRYFPGANTTAEWELATETIKVQWSFQVEAEIVQVTERFSVAAGSNQLLREVELSGPALLEARLYANPALYSNFGTTEKGLWAEGYERIEITAEAAKPNERTLLFEVGSANRARLVYTIGREESGGRISTAHTSTLTSTDPFWLRVADQFHKSVIGLKSAISDEGRFDASIWQYGFEWSGDASMVLEALLYAGEFERAKLVLLNLLTRLTSEDGFAAESSRFRRGAEAELNNIGEVLRGTWLYADWTGEREILAHHFERISSLANRLLSSEHCDNETGMLRGTRDIWERGEAAGMLPGYDVSHQVFGILGLRAAAKIADLLGKRGSSDWRAAADKIESSFFYSPTHSFIRNGRVKKRVLLSGEEQAEVKIPETADKEYMEKFMPGQSANEAPRRWTPDISQLFPAYYGLTGDIDQAALLDDIELLWSQAWEGGGYGRYNVDAEPDSPGPWPFATAFVAGVQLSAGPAADARRSIEWLLQKAGKSGAWFEFYGQRPTPPLPPMGIIVWGWAQFINLVVQHVLRTKIEDTLHVDPVERSIHGTFRFRDSSYKF